MAVCDQSLGLEVAATSVRDVWSHAVASALQPVVGEILDVDGETFAEPFKRLADRTPPPASIAERRDLKARFVELAQQVGTDFHTLFHRTRLHRTRCRRTTPVTCGFLAIESSARIWFDSTTDPRQLLTAWASAYATEFARHHPLPPAWRAARILRQRVAQPAGIQGIALAIGASRSALDPDFKRMFGMTPIEYHARVRLAHGLTELRDRGTKVEDAARRAGFASVKNFNRAARHYTAMTPSQVRRLTPAEFARLLLNELQTDPAVLTRAASRAESLEVHERHVNRRK